MPKPRRKFAIAVGLIAGFAALAGIAAADPATHGLAMHGGPALIPDFKSLPYANPDAPKGGKLRLAVQGSFDSLNPLIILGSAAQGLRGYVYESLLERSNDEPFSLYGLVAEKVETPDDRSFVEFTLNPKAKFSDGQPVTVDDVIFSMETLRDHGRPNHRDYYSKVAKAEKIGERGVRFTFKVAGDREIPLILGLMPVLPKHALDPATFEKTTIVPPIGTGPYIVSKVEPGSSITYTLNPDYWAKDLPIMRGRNNFQEIRLDYFRDQTATFEAFKSGDADYQTEGDPERWTKAYDFPSIVSGKALKAEFSTGLPAPMSCFVFNTRKPMLADKRVREALTLLFDFEWINKSIFNGLYVRNESFFDRSGLSSAGKPASDAEKALLGADISEVAPDILAGTFHQPQSKADGQNRDNLRKAFGLLKEAGFAVVNGVMTNAAGEPLKLEAISKTRDEERLFTLYADGLKRAGIELTIRSLESTSFNDRVRDYQFDIMQFSFVSSLSPGNEQRFRWLSENAGKPGTFNYPGVKSPAIDRVIDKVLAAKTDEDFTAAVRALDRLLLSGRYVLPLFHTEKVWVAHAAKLKHPDKSPLSGVQLDTWWIDPAAP